MSATYDKTEGYTAPPFGRRLYLTSYDPGRRVSREDAFCVIDFETTGFTPATAEVIEFAAVRVRGGELGLNLASLCAPTVPITPEITRVNGIDNAMVEGYPPFGELLPLLLDFIGEDIIAAHNASFDMSFLKAYCERAGIELEPRVFCTLTAARQLYAELPSKRLGEVAAHLGVDGTGYHRALADATVTAKVLVEMLKTI